MGFDLIERRLQGKIITKKTPLSHRVKSSIYLLIVTLLSGIVILSIVFLLTTSQAYQKGNVLQKKQDQKEDLLIEKRNLVNKIIDAMAYKKIEESPLVKNMQKPENPIYIED